MINPPAVTVSPLSGVEMPPPEASQGVFVATVAALKNGLFSAQLDDALRDVTQAVNATQQKGSVTLKLTIVPNGVGAGDAPLYKVTPKIGRSTPEKPEKGQTFFSDHHHNLSRRNPGQEDFTLTLVRAEIPGVAPRALARVAGE